MDLHEAKDEALPVAIAIGVDPAIKIAAGVRYDGDELCIAGAIRGEGIKVSRGVTVDLNIPAEAEIVIEGKVPPHEREGRGRWPNSMVSRQTLAQPSLPGDCYCWRDNPIYETIIPGWNEHVYIGSVLAASRYC